jgi:lipid-binding SYLF domain-containing protein
MTRLIATITTILLAIALNTATAASKLDRRVDAATEVLEQITRIPEQGIPPNLLRNAHAIAVIPGTIKAGFLIGGTYGKGILVVRQSDGGWSNPSFITMGGGSFGWQVGAQSSDIILVFKTRKGLEDIYRGRMTLGGDANVAAGPVGRSTSASTDARLNAEIYSYARNRGLFAGISLQGNWIGMDNKANYAFYQDGQGSAARILKDDHLPTPAHARHFLEVLAARTPAPNGQAPGSRSAKIDSAARQTESGGAKTYGIDEAPAAQSEIIF